MKLLSVIIVGYKNYKVLKDCLDSIRKYNDIGEKLEVIVVDNSPDSSYIYNHNREEFSEVITIRGKKNGFGAGNNAGVRMAKGEYLLFLNADTILIEPIFEYAVGKFKEDSLLSLFGLKLLNKDLSDSLSYYFIDRIGLIYILLIRFFNKMNIFISNKMFISGADIFIRKDVFVKAGMFDENIFMYKEECDLLKRISMLDKRLKIKYFKDKRIIHIGRASSNTKIIAIEESLKSRLYYYKKYGMNSSKFMKKQIRLYNKKMFYYKFINKKKYQENKVYKDIYLKAIRLVGECYEK